MATFRKRNEKWIAEVSVKGTRRSKTFPNKMKAKSWASEMEYQLGQRIDGVSPTQTLKEVFTRYANEVSNEKKGARWEIVRLNKFCTYSLADIKLIDLRREHIEDWIQLRLQSVKPSSVNRELNLISHSLTQARRWRLMTHNPMDDLKRPKDPPHRDRRISDNEIELLKLTLNYDDRFEVVQQQQRVAIGFLLALETAMRAGEICSITAMNIDLNKKTVFLPDTKNGLPRYVPLSTEAVKLLNKLQPWPEDGPVLCLRSGTLSTIYKKAVSKSGIDNLTFHDTRHEAITRLARKLDVLDLARMVGHRDIKQLMTYYNKDAEELALQLN